MTDSPSASSAQPPGAVTGIGVRPISTPLPLGFPGLCVATFCFAGLQPGHRPSRARWQSTAGWIGVLLATMSEYAALAFELEGVDKRAVLPLWRRNDAATAMNRDAAAYLTDLTRKPGVRRQL
ncbi:hypothetical protein [Rhodococcus indonesiensis]